MAGDSFVQAILKERMRQGKVLDSATAQLGSGRTTAISRAPVNAPATQPEQLPNAQATESLAQATNLPPSLPPIDTGIGTMYQDLVKSVADLTAKVDASMVPDDSAFYQQTGRNMTARDKALLEAKRNFLMNHGKMPTPEELFYEARRGLLTDTSGPASLA